MLAILRQRGLRLIFVANLISMLGSGMNSAAVVWYILQVTHSEMALGTVIILQTIPALLMLPFTGVIIDDGVVARLAEDRFYVSTTTTASLSNSNG